MSANCAKVEPRSSTRVSYPFAHWIAPYYDDDESVGGFAEVKCHDLSVTGISFGVAARPQTTQLVLKIKHDNLTAFLLVDVQHITELETPEGDKFLVGCQFVRRLAEINELANASMQ